MNLVPEGRCRIEPWSGGGSTPLVVQPVEGAPELLAQFAGARAYSERHLHESGALLFRGFSLSGSSDFREFCARFGQTLLNYEFASTPRSEVGAGVYSSTEYPAHQTIPLHSEQSYSRSWPMKIWFYSMQVAAEGGATPIADTRQIYHLIPASIRARFERDGVMYVRNYGGGLDLPWSEVFRTDDRAVVERYCRPQGISCEWSEGGELRTRQICQASARHPVIGSKVWFNQAHLFHVSNLEPEVREALEDSVEPEDLPRNVFYGDGTAIEDTVLDEIRDVLERTKISFPWQSGDVLMLDNMLCAHSRDPFRGPRKVVVAMAEPCA